MALELKQGVRLSQQLVITPQLQQAIKLLQLSHLELAGLIQKELEENPVLEEASEDSSAGGDDTLEPSNGELHEQAKEEDRGHEHLLDEVGTKDNQLKEPNDFDWENYITNTYNAPGYNIESQIAAGGGEDLPTYENFLRQTETLQEHLLWQLHMSQVSEQDARVATEIIGNINDDGYLSSSLEEIAATQHVSLEEAERALKIVHDFDPTGVAARDLQECLLLQVRHLNTADAADVEKLIREHLPELERHDYAKISKQSGFSTERIAELQHIIQSLEPKPGRPYSADNAQFITPDVYVQKVGDEYVITLNEEGMPRLQISNLYRRSLMKGSDATQNTKDYIQERLRAAMWLIKSIHQRQRTMYKVARSIVKFQHDFFEHGITHLKPLVLKDVAEDVEMHESTISRVTTNKYIHTPRGIFELKFFFNSGIHLLEGGGVASEAVKSRIRSLIAAENPSKPLSDQEIADELKRSSIDIARRTVAKYREMMGLLPSSKRRRLT